jgi:hypothetical protein
MSPEWTLVGNPNLEAKPDLFRSFSAPAINWSQSVPPPAAASATYGASRRLGVEY